MILKFSSPRHGFTGNDGISVFIDLGHKDVIIDDNSDGWAKLNTTIGSLERRTQFLFGFHDRARMLRFAADIVSDKLPSLSTHGEVQYTVALACDWYQASLDSEELQGSSVLYSHSISVLTDQRQAREQKTRWKCISETGSAFLESTPTSHPNLSTAPVASVRYAHCEVRS